MKLSAFSYHLPEKLIAQQPSYPRDACRLMALDRAKKTIVHRKFYELLDLLHAGDVLVLNNSKVLPVRLTFSIQGKAVELFLTRQLDDEHWLAIGSPGKVLKKDFECTIAEDLLMKVLEVRDDGQRKIQFFMSGKKFEELLYKIGKVPFPPYLKKVNASFEDYQTVFAQQKGSVAAPTAGLHFTKKLLNRLEQKGVHIEYVTLHVGLGTFAPVKMKNLEDHQMHGELYTLSPSTAKRLQKAKKEGKRIIAVGTTTVRVLEDSYDKNQKFRPGCRETSLYIYPGYQWKCVDALVTNFHLPQSTLLLLTCSFGGTEFVLKAYKEAIRKSYRFYSFGDAMFIF